MNTGQDDISLSYRQHAPVINTGAAVTNALTALGACTRYMNLYGAEHPLMQEKMIDAHNLLVRLLIIQPIVTIGITDPYLTLDRFPIEDPTANLAAFAKLLNARRVVEMQLSAGIAIRDIEILSEILMIAPDEIESMGGIENEMKMRGAVHIQLKEGEVVYDQRDLTDPSDVYNLALNIVGQTFDAVRTGRRIPVPEIRIVVSDTLRNIFADDSAMLALATIRSYNRYLAEHSVNTCILSMALGRDLGLDASVILELGIAAILHETGKAFLPHSIEDKSGKLTEEEWEQVRRHPVEGARMLAGFADLPALAATIALEHHAYCDGSGYPFFPPKHKIHLLSRLVAIVDSYDALTTDRPFRERWSPQKAIGCMLYESHERYDKQLLARFASKAKLYPIGSIVRLKTGDIAIILGGSKEHPYQPDIRMITGSQKGETISLSEIADPLMGIESLAEPVEAIIPYTSAYIE